MNKIDVKASRRKDGRINLPVRYQRFKYSVHAIDGDILLVPAYFELDWYETKSDEDITWTWRDTQETMPGRELVRKSDGRTISAEFLYSGDYLVRSSLQEIKACLEEDARYAAGWCSTMTVTGEKPKLCATFAVVKLNEPAPQLLVVGAGDGKYPIGTIIFVKTNVFKYDNTPDVVTEDEVNVLLENETAVRLPDGLWVNRAAYLQNQMVSGYTPYGVVLAPPDFSVTSDSGYLLRSADEVLESVADHSDGDQKLDKWLKGREFMLNNNIFRAIDAASEQAYCSSSGAQPDHIVFQTKEGGNLVTRIPLDAAFWPTARAVVGRPIRVAPRKAIWVSIADGHRKYIDVKSKLPWM